MSDYSCRRCKFLYSEREGDSKNGIVKGTSLNDLKGSLCSACWMNSPKRYVKMQQVYRDLEAQSYSYICGKYNFSFYEQELQEICSLAGHNILEVGSGTGRVTQALVKANYQVTALDESEEMMMYLVKQGWSQRDNCKTVVENYFNYESPVTYELVYFSDTTFQELVQQQSLTAVLTQASKFLNKGGHMWLELAIPIEHTWQYNRRKMLTPERTLYYSNSGQVNLFDQTIHYTSMFDEYCNGRFVERYRQERDLALVFQRDIEYLTKDDYELLEARELPKTGVVVTSESKTWVDGGYPLPSSNQNQRSLFLRLKKKR
ncbi:methyltransferase domain-containing protein [Vagococcus intermedius]|uniref:Class I SAM-dependent methyltransferase n=1 Tax=Vagococcus intermedius TaxID=2991418 RepID=A0AAF0CUC1_9ENTE|nr:methyltransferase domain-containing protein [Vagococcus intermedius]WEG73016.1 class I SAM-dependent methyltransferase [Vagococcus intermedius]WEG75102.1 class I SAM-dependent methyltransferase [Vagococcus intermedius]